MTWKCTIINRSLLCFNIAILLFRRRTCAAFAATALVLLLIGSLQCNMVKFTATERKTDESFSLYFGIHYYQTWSVDASMEDGIQLHKYCHEYPDSITIDDYWKTAKISTVIACTLGFSFLLLNVIWVCAHKENLSTGGWEGPEYVIVAIATGLSLLFLKSNGCKENILVKGLSLLYAFPESCKISNGAAYFIVATVLWVFAAAANFTARAADGESISVFSSSAAPIVAAEEEPLIGHGS